MPRLGDLIGTLMAEFTLARVRADLEAVKLVELYRSEGLLAGAPVPRFRLPDITVDLPVLVSELEDSETSGGFKRPSVDAIRSAIREAAATTNYPLDTAWESEILKQVDAHFQEAWTDKEPVDRALLIARNGVRVAESVVDKRRIENLRATRSEASRAVPAEPARPAAVAQPSAEPMRDPTAEAFVRAFALRMNTKAIGASGEGPRLMMAAKTSEVREVGDSGLVTRISMTFKEDGFEVASIERADGTTDLRLTPE